MTLHIDKFLPKEILDNCKVHAARWNGEDYPLDVFLRSQREWKGWNSYRGNKDEFNKKYIVAFIQFYPEKDTWLFGGVFKVAGRSSQPGPNGYDIEKVKFGAELVGRLKVGGKLSRGRAFLPDTFFGAVEITELLKEPYSGETFAGFDKCSVDFAMLEILVNNDRPDWKAALQNVNGIYLISDKKTGKMYVGSAYGDDGIWHRWSQYVANGHGWNKNLVRLGGSNGVEYARKHFHFTLLESWPFQTDKNIVLSREGYWKEALMTRDYGYNAN